MAAADTPEEIPPRYDAAATERALYEAWERAGVFHADAGRSNRSGGSRQPFVVPMPPPNVTAVLHVGHGLNNTVQDVLVRWRRMCGDETLWQPGTDHAGIATQNVVEKQLAAEGTTRDAMGREAFVERTRKFADETRGAIFRQLEIIGSSADWRRMRYTFTPEMSRAVREVFVRLYEDPRKLVYRGHRVIHWCPRCLTSLSDEEAEASDTQGTLFKIRYPLASDPSQGVVVATTRPESMLGDVAVAVHPDDDRYAALVGKKVRLPIVDIEIPVIADEFVDREFGTGVVKITPAHDPNDFEVGKRHGLPMPVIMTPDAKMGASGVDAARVPERLRGVDRFEARKRIVKELDAAGLLVDRENHRIGLRKCYRCETVVEPRLSDQWFVKMKPLAEPGLAAVRDGRIRILPERWNATYFHWMENIRDWNISRQIWWGHRVPVWRCESCGFEKAFREDPPATCTECGKPWTQDPDVLDTWFSSWLWPFSTLGWPDKTEDLKAFYPADVLVTAPEILFLWVARMIMSGFYCMGEAPFHTVYLHGTVRDMQHRKMSKSLGNGIDPLEVVKLYGADALRYTLIAGMGLGVDVMLDPNDLEKSFAPGRNFATKLWNIGRFLLMQVGTGPVKPFEELERSKFRSADDWIVRQLGEAIRACDEALGPARPSGKAWTEAERTAGLRLDNYAEAARRFVWNDLADWYVESSKPRLEGSGEDREITRALLVHCFDQSLRLLHPMMPFITEDLWHRLPGYQSGAQLARAAWPVSLSGGGERPGASHAAFQQVKDVITAIRQVRNDYVLAPQKELDAHVTGPETVVASVRSEGEFIFRMSRARLAAGSAAPGAAAHAVLEGGLEVVIPLEGIVDVARERAKLGDEIASLDKQLTALRGRLGSEKFVSKAPPEIVAAERAKEGEWAARLTQLHSRLAAFGGSA